MKKLFALSLLTAFVAGLSSCGTDEPAAYPDVMVDCGKLLTITIDDGNGKFNHLCEASCIITVDPNKNTAQILVRDASFDPRMPFSVSYLIDGVTLTNFKMNGEECSFNLNAAEAQMLNLGTNEPYDGYTITDVKGHIDTFKDITTISYKVNTRGTTYQVVSTDDELRTVISGSEYDNTTELYYEYDLDLETMKADVYIFNVQFAVGDAKSPVLKKICIPGVPFEGTGNGYKLAGTDIIPLNYSGGGAVPMGDRFVVTNFSATLNVTSGSHHIFFNCMGGEHEGSIALAL